jgi:hypothetical protein
VDDALRDDLVVRLSMVPSLGAARVFRRFSAFKPDRPVDAISAKLLPETCACPESGQYRFQQPRGASLEPIVGLAGRES